MLSSEQKEFFKKEGYLLVPGVLDKEEILNLRKRILQIFESGDWKRSPFNTERVLSDVFNYFPEFIPITLNEKVLSIMKDLLGEAPILLPETAIHHGFYTGWHKDTTSQEKMGHTFQYEKDALMLEAGFYLQDNDELGGGLTVMPGSHLDKDIFHLPRKKRSLFKRAFSKISGYRESSDETINPFSRSIVDIPSKSGDLVLFNFLLNHRATRPLYIKPEEISAERSKLAFFNAFSANNSYADEYLQFLYSRKEPFYQALKTVVGNPELIAYCKSNQIHTI